MSDGGRRRRRLRSRNDHNLNHTYPELVDALAQSATLPLVLDGEVVAFDGNVTSFSTLQPRIEITDVDEARASDVRVCYHLFDVLHVDGFVTTALPLRQRKTRLRHCVTFADSSSTALSQWAQGGSGRWPLLSGW